MERARQRESHIARDRNTERPREVDRWGRDGKDGEMERERGNAGWIEGGNEGGMKGRREI